MHTSHLNPVLDTSIEMKTFLFLLVLGYASSDKLDLTYLPPPGSQYAGGRPEDIQIPLEFPKETQSTTYRPETGDNRGLSPENFKPTIGIDRVPGQQDVISVLNPGSPLPNIQNTQRVPTTTVSYAFTQTTTHPPTEGFETTIGPQVTGGFPTTDIFNNFPSQEPGLIYQGNNAQNRPGYQQTVNQFGQRPTLAPQSGPIYEGVSSQQPGSAYEGNFNGQNRPGFKEIIDQFGKPVLVPSTGPGTQFTGSSTPSMTTGQQFTQNYPNQQQVANQFQAGLNQQTLGGNVPGLSTGSFEQHQHGNQSFVGDNRPAFVPSTSAPQDFPSTLQPGPISIGENTSGLPGSFPQGIYPGQQIRGSVFQPNINLRPNQTPSGQQIFDDRQIANQRFPGSPSPNQYVGTGNTQYLPSSTTAPTFTPGVSNQQFPSTSVSPIYNNEGSVSGSQQYPGSQQFTGTPADSQNVFVPSSTTASTFTSGIPYQGVPSGTSIRPGISGQPFPSSIVPGSVSTPRYPGSEANAVSTVYRNRPERPQAEADRNAVILNYENEITPEGFAYSFDTSNGIHADENGTAIDGVKAQGSYSYTGDDGKVYSVVYTADEDGFRPRGDHLPTAPPIPEAIQRVIEQAEKDKAAGITHDGSYDENKYGHKKYKGAIPRPQLANRVISDAGDTYEDSLPGTVVRNKDQRIRPQAGQRHPTISTDRGQYTNDYLETGPRTNEQITNDLNKRKPGQQSTQRPISRVTDISENDQGITLDEDFDQNQGTTARPFVSRRPVNQSGKKQFSSQSNEDFNAQNNDRQRPIGKVTSSQGFSQDQDTDEYAEGPKEGDISKNRFKIKNPSRRPVNYDENDEYETEDAATSDTYKKEKSPKRPLPTRKPFRRPGSNIVTENDDELTQQNFDQYGQPISGKGQSNIKQQIGSKQPSKPFTTSSGESQTVTEDYDADEDYVTKVPSKNYPGNTADDFGSRDQNIPSNYPGKTSDKTGSRNQNTSTYYPGNTSNKFGTRDQNIPSRMRQRPTTSGVKVSADKDIEMPIESDTDENIQLQDYNNRHPTLPGKTPSRDDRYEEEISESEDFETTERDYTDRPKQSSTIYSTTTGRPQISQSTTSINNSRNKNAGEKHINAQRPGMKFGQRINRPGFNQNTNIIESNVYDNHPTNESGYQYIPPQRKFEHDEVQVTPNRFKGTTRRPFTGRPTPGDYYEDKDIPSKPFMTPNVSYLGKEDDEKINQGVISAKPGLYIEKEQRNQFDEYSNGGTTPDETYGNDEVTSTKPFNQFSTRRPAFQQPTGRPKYTQNVPSFTKQRINQEGKPSQDTNTRYYEGTKTPSGIVSSTTPMPSTRTQSSTVGSTRPGQRDEIYYTIQDGYKKPGKISISSTTPLPSQSPNFDGFYNEDGQYQTTYRPSGTIQPTTGYEDVTTGQRFPTVGPTDADINITPGVTQNRYQGNQPSTTYRPNLVTGQTQPSSTIRPSVSVDRYGRPIIIPGSATTVQSYGPGKVPSTLSPEGTVDIYGRPVSPGFDSTVQEYIPGDHNIPSSTATPGVLVDAFGRPVVRPGSGSTVQGFVPGSGNEVSSTIRPEVTVDAFGRPVPTPENTLGNGDYISGGLREPSSTTRPQSIDAFGRPIKRPGSETQEYGPGGQIQPSTTVSPGVTVDAYGRPITALGVNPPGYTGYTTPSGNIGQGLPGSPSFGGQSSTSVPSGQFRGDQRYQTSSMRPDIGQGTFLTFQPSTERIIGEDFSGPKQQQKFDPEHGYYYK